MSLVLVGFYLAPLIWAAPTPNLTALHNTIAPAWVDEPSSRGTWGLLYSCSFTLLLCVYTAIHLNVPGFYDTPRKIWLRKAKWVAIAIFGPEIVVYVAFEQWFYARKFLKDLKAIADKSTDEKVKKWYTQDPKGSPLDMVYAHYVLMGGFAIDVEEIHNTFKLITCTTDGVLFLAKYGHFCKVSRDDIEDKSKADVLAKSLVCVQVLWVIGQAIERKAAGYPISLLEIHTIVHVVCALVMYALWFQKPLNVQKPTILELGEDLDLVAFGLQTSTQRHYRPGLAPVGEQPLSLQYGFRDQRYGDTVPEFSIAQPPFVWFRQTEPVKDGVPGFCGNIEITESTTSNSIPIITQCGLKKSFRAPPKEKSAIYVPNVPLKDQDIGCTLLSGQSLDGKIGLDFDGPRSGLFSAIAASMSHKDISRLHLISKFVERIECRNSLKCLESGNCAPGAYWDVSSGQEPLRLEHLDHSCYSGFCYRAASTELSSLFDMWSDTKYLLGAALALIPTAYGCVHLGAMSIMFPTAMEKLLWKISCFYLIATAATSAATLAVVYIDRLTAELIEPPICDKWGFKMGPLRAVSKRLSKFLGVESGTWVDTRRLLKCVVLLCILLPYIAARIYLVIESFISLRHVPIGVYQSPSLNFFGNIPHI
ncbi:hypothetical protein VTL71DRAFT_14077 [Oculimacula yallundae]|uniref:Uncharacterized protein n=1 Tax=Oculimacula yallundae TaxID=86028 RepID=A0ABR4CJK6_9HELO